MTRPVRENPRPPLTWAQVLTLVIVVGVVMIVIDFGQRLAASQRLVDSANIAATEVGQLEREQAALATQVAYATTDGAVIAWAHEQGKMVQPGEVLVVPLLPTPAVTATPAPAPGPTPLPNWRLWYSEFLEPATAHTP